MNLQNLVDWAQYNEIDIFEGVTVPDPLDAETVKSAIMVRSGLMTPLYKEPRVFQSLVTHWFITKQWTFEHLIKIIQSEYSPIENYNRHEDSTITLSGTDTVDMEGGNTQTHSGTDTTEHSGIDTTAHSGTDTTTEEISAENVGTYSPDSQSSLLHGESIDLTHGESIDLTHGHTITDAFEDRKDTTTYGKIDTRESDIHGNIGVTTTQQMIEQDLELLRHFDIYGWIAEQFENDNMLLIY